MCLDYGWVDPLRAPICHPNCLVGSMAGSRLVGNSLPRRCGVGGYLIGFGADDYSSTDHVEERHQGAVTYHALKAASQAAFRAAVQGYRVAASIPFVTDTIGIPGVTAAAVSRTAAAGELLTDFLARETHAGRYVLAGDDLLQLKDPAAVVSIPADRLGQLVSLPEAAEIVVVGEPPVGKGAISAIAIVGLGLGAVTIIGALAGWFSPTTTRRA
jgi:hypothetical protein